MFNLLKWNITDYIKKNTWILIGIAASLLFAALPRNSFGLLNNLLIGLASISGLILFQAGILTSFLFAFRWAENSSVELELSLPVSSYKQIAVKLLTGALVNFLSLIFLLQLFLLIGRFSSGSYQWITGEHLRGVLGWVVFLTFLEGSVLFAYIFFSQLPHNTPCPGSFHRFGQSCANRHGRDLHSLNNGSNRSAHRAHFQHEFYSDSGRQPANPFVHLAKLGILKLHSARVVGRQPLASKPFPEKLRFTAQAEYLDSK